MPFLMYHELELPGRRLCEDAPGYRRYAIPVAGFETQLRHLAETGRRGTSVGAALEQPASAQTVVLTFDDGCETDLIAAAPRLAAASFGATFYVTVGFLGRRGYLSAAQLRELAGMGFEIGSHALTHRFLPDLPFEALRAEVIDSRSRLEDITGNPVRHFSCPGGRWSPAVVAAAREGGYASVATSCVGLNGPRSNRYALARIAILREMRFPAFARVVRGEGLWRDQAKERALGVAKRLLGNRSYERLRRALLRSGTEG